MGQNFWDLLNEQRDSLTKSGIIIADYLTTHKEDAQFLSISSLAKECNTAEATIFRFCKQLGFKGYNDMKISLAQANVSSHNILSDPSGTTMYTSELFKHVYQSFITVMDSTTSALSPEAIDQAATILQQAKTVYCFGQGGSMMLANDIWVRLSMISNKFRTCGDSHLQLVAASLMSSSDAIIFVSYSGATHDMMDTLQVARSNGTKIILITRYPDSAGADYADIVLTCGGNETPLDSGSIPIKISQLFVAEALVLRYSLNNQELVQLSREKTSSALACKLL